MLLSFAGEDRKECPAEGGGQKIGNCPALHPLSPQKHRFREEDPSGETESQTGEQGFLRFLSPGNEHQGSCN